MLSLAVHHNIWLTRDQRYNIHAGIELTVVGSSIHVWVSNDKTTSEPAREIFCKYYLKNNKIDAPIQILSDGYQITLPYREWDGLNLTDDEWRTLNFYNPEKLDDHYKKCSKGSNSNNLLDIVDGGSKCLSFREHNKVDVNNKTINFIHFVNIMDMEELTNSLI